MFVFWKERREQWLLIGVSVAFALLVMVKVKFAVPEVMKGPDWVSWVSFFQSKAFEDIVGDLLTGLIAAYFFYVLIDLLPRHKREQSATRTLNLIIASVVDAYENRRTYGHEDLISLNDVGVIERPNLKHHIQHLISLAKAKFTLDDYYRLRCALACVDSRMQDFRAVLPLAITLSPEHVLQWIQLTDRARLIHEELHSAPVGLDVRLMAQHAFGDPPEGVSKDDGSYLAYVTGMRMYALTLAQRMVQFLLEVDAWMVLPGKPEPFVTQRNIASFGRP